MALSLEKVIGKKSGVDRSFRKGKIKPWQTENEKSNISNYSSEDQAENEPIKCQHRVLLRPYDCVEETKTLKISVDTSDNNKESIAGLSSSTKTQSNNSPAPIIPDWDVYSECDKAANPILGSITWGTMDDDKATVSSIEAKLDDTANKQLDNNKITNHPDGNWEVGGIRQQQDNNKITTRQQQDNNKTTTRQQQDNNKITNHPDGNWEVGGIRQQQDNNKITTRQQQDNNKITTRQQQDNKTAVGSEPLAEDILDVLMRLSKQQQRLLLYIHEFCVRTGNLSTGVILSHNIELHLEASNNTVRTQLFRLIEKRLLVRQPGKKGRGGFHAFSMPLKVFKAANELQRILRNELVLKPDNETIAITEQDNNKITTRQQQDNNKITTRQQQDNTNDNKPLPSLPSSSSNLIKTTTTTSDPEFKNEEIEGFEEIDITPLKEIGFRKFHLEQIKKRTDLSSEMIQVSINHFAFDLRNNQKAEKISGSPLNFFMGILVKRGPYSPPDNYEDEKIKALKEFYEEQKIQQAKFKEAEEKALDIAFENWFVSLSQEEIYSRVPPMMRDPNFSHKNRKFAMKGHFIENEWPTMRAKIFKEI